MLRAHCKAVPKTSHTPHHHLSHSLSLLWCRCHLRRRRAHITRQRYISFVSKYTSSVHKFATFHNSKITLWLSLYDRWLEVYKTKDDESQRYSSPLAFLVILLPLLLLFESIYIVSFFVVFVFLEASSPSLILHFSFTTKKTWCELWGLMAEWTYSPPLPPSSIHCLTYTQTRPHSTRQKKEKAFSNWSNSDDINIYHDIKWTRDLQMWMSPNKQKKIVIISHKDTYRKRDQYQSMLLSICQSFAIVFTF